jgi:hypothetical protein
VKAQVGWIHAGSASDKFTRVKLQDGGGNRGNRNIHRHVQCRLANPGSFLKAFFQTASLNMDNFRI